ncbi:Flocculin type 3 repeat-containing protein, partial [Debaryomyces fabryi]
MVRLSISSLAIFTSLLTAKAAAKDVLCLVNDVPVATVDLDTGVCPFTLPAELVAFFDYTSSEDYNIQFYYAIANSARYFTDIVNAGTEIDIPANQIYGTDGAPVYQVHVENTPASNSTAAIRKRMLNQVEVIKRDEASDFAESLKSVDGTLVNSALFKVVDIPSGSSSIASGTPTGTIPVSSGVNTVGDVTETLESTKIITVTHCSDNKCSAATVPATPTVTTYTVDGTVTSYTTYCPLTDAAD